MPRQIATTVDNTFIKGLLTENTALKFPENAVTDTYDCIFDETGRISRRLGFDYESGQSLNTIGLGTTDAFTEFIWTAVGGDGTVSFLVIQHGTAIEFYNLSASTTAVSSSKQSFSIDLNTYLPSGSGKTPAIYPCSYALISGDLVIVNPAASPIYVSYNAAGNTITVTAINVLYRDFLGLDDTLGTNDRPTETVASLKTNNPNHYYNLLNQGWGSTDALSQWDTALTTMPSNADTVGFTRSSTTDAFDATLVTSKGPGNRLAPRGHYILTAWSPDRNAAMTAEGFTGATISTTYTLIDRSAGTSFSNSDAAGGPYAWGTHLFDGTTNLSSVAVGVDDPITQLVFPTSHAWVGKNYTASPKSIGKAVFFGSNDQGFVPGANPNITVELHGNNTAPVLGTEGTVLGSITFADTANESAGRTITSSDTVSQWKYVWLYFAVPGVGSGHMDWTEVQFHTLASVVQGTVTTFERPSVCETFASRIWYAGINALGLNNSIFFSQIPLKQSQYGLCYQANDPTSESFFDLLSDDGGVIKIPEMGQVVHMCAYQTSLLVFASNGVWQITGSPFKANDFVVRKLSNIGTFSPNSFVLYRGIPFWWGDTGIYTVNYDANYDSFSVVSVTNFTIWTFLNNIPPLNKQFVKGTVDIQNDVIVWLYNNSTNLASTDHYKFTNALCMNGLSQAFYPWTITSDTPKVRGLIYCQDAQRLDTPRIKYVVTQNIASVDSISFAETNGTGYKDWPTFTNTSYSSYFITGYKIHGDTQRFFQPNYMFVFLETAANSSCFMQAIFDFTTSTASGKWSNPQQVYNPSLANRSINFRRLKVRGKGRALQFKMYSEAGKPFTLIGWSLFESGNAAL